LHCFSGYDNLWNREGQYLPNFFGKEKITMPDLSVEIAGIRMQNPVMNAAGTLDIEPEAARQLF